MDKFLELAPIIIVVAMFFIQQRIFVTPEQLEKKHREIFKEADERYVILSAYLGFREEVKDDMKEVKESLNEIKSMLMSRGDL